MRKGSTKPRIFTPPLAPLEPRSPETEKRTFGYSAIDFAEEVCGIELYPWQKWLLVHALERDTFGMLRFRQVVILVARQQGKSTLSQVLSLWSMYVYPHLVDIPNRMTVIGTAQDLDTAESVWDGALELVEEIPELAELADRPVKVNGKKAIKLLSGEQYKVKAANRKAGRGLSGDLIILDELREHQNWDAWAAVVKTATARPHAQVWALSNAGDMTSVVLRHLRKMAHQALGDPDGICKADALVDTQPTDLDVVDDSLDAGDLEPEEDTLGLFEWSAPPDCDKWDRDGWAWANPSLGYGGVTERTLASDCRTDPEWVFRTETLCQWPDGALEGPFAPGKWEEGTNEVVITPDGQKTVAAADRITSRVHAAIDMSPDRSVTYVTFAGTRDDGLAQVEVVAQKRGTEWVGPWLMDPKRRERIIEVGGQGKGAPISETIDRLDKDPTFTIPVVAISGSNLTAVHGITQDAVRDGTVRHNVQPVLDMAAQTAVVKDFGGGARVLDRRHSPVDISSLMAFEESLWLLTRYVPPPPPPPPPPESFSEADLDFDDYALEPNINTMSF